MHRLLRHLASCGYITVLALTGAGSVLAATGDTLRVVGERVNLRAGPSDNATVRSQIVQGEQLLELQRDGNWYGVRVLRTGEEGWIFGNLIEPLTASTLGGGAGAATAGFAELSRDFDRLMGNLTQRYGFPLFEKVHQAGGNTLEATLTPNGSEPARMTSICWRRSRSTRCGRTTRTAARCGSCCWSRTASAISPLTMPRPLSLC